MREKPRDKGRLLHIEQAINNIFLFMEGKDAEDFQLDKMLYFAVVKNIEIIGEAAFMLTKEFKESHSDTPWNDIINMRHILVHGYYQVDSSIVWTSIKTDIPALRHQISQYLTEFTDE